MKAAQAALEPVEFCKSVVIEYPLIGIITPEFIKYGFFDNSHSHWH